MDRPTVPEVLPLAKAFYEDNPVGGVLHIVLDDGNLHDEHIRFCLTEARKENDTRAIELAELLLRMTMTQRRKVYASL